MQAQTPGSRFYREYDLVAARRMPPPRLPASHQQTALQKLGGWFQRPDTGPRGGLLVLPTGGGKTFTALNFLCGHPLSADYKVLWLAHTHHLLEQAFDSLENLTGLIREPRSRLHVRVVSGTPGHFPVRSIKAGDDVVVATLQTISGAFREKHEGLDRFLASASGKLFVVFDEAHHAPAPSYRQLLQGLQQRVPAMRLLGLIATPIHEDERKRGWLPKLFPQGILHEVEATNLMAAGILSRPVIEEARTAFEPSFDEREYEKWVGTNRDLPEDIISALAQKKERNDAIVAHYVANRAKYGKTIIFADRWFQCEYLCEKLNANDIRADAVYSRVDPGPDTVEARNRRTADDNARALHRFRDGELDVLINVRMLTEGTDVPKVQTVFLTRQTTSQILLTQMVGRALRGPKFGGTEHAYIVSFIDNWKQRINWAAFESLASGQAVETVPEYPKRPPLQLISIDLVRRLARQMESGINVNPLPFCAVMPVGWYRVEYYAQVQGSDDVEPVGGLVLVFDGEKERFDRFIEELTKLSQSDGLSDFESDDVNPEEVAPRLEGWVREYFAGGAERVGGGLTGDLCMISRHVAQPQNAGRPPKYFEFEARKNHDLDAIANQFLSDRLDRWSETEALEGEYRRQDRFWRVLYPNFEQFASHYDGCARRIQRLARGGAPNCTPQPFTTPESVPDREPSEEVKAQVRARDKRCLCCGKDSGRGRPFQVDHIYPSYHGGTNDMDNLQTLCRICNGAKRTRTVNFRTNKSPLTGKPDTFPQVDTPAREKAKEIEEWERFLRRSVNLFYQCAAVSEVEVGARGPGLRTWRVKLFGGNDPLWLDSHVPTLVTRIRDAKEKAGFTPGPDNIEVE